MTVAGMTEQRARDLLALLTPREREVAMARITTGSCKGAARELGIARKTVEVHSHAILQKTELVAFEQIAVVACKAGAI